MSVVEYIMIFGLLLNLGTSVLGFIKLSINYEHRFTKLETEMSIIVKELLATQKRDIL